MQEQSPVYFIDHHMVAWGDKVKSKYIIDNNTLTQDHKKILRLPTYHPGHILTELVWADVKQGFTIKKHDFHGYGCQGQQQLSKSEVQKWINVCNYVRCRMQASSTGSCDRRHN